MLSINQLTTIINVMSSSFVFIFLCFFISDDSSCTCWRYWPWCLLLCCQFEIKKLFFFSYGEINKAKISNFTCFDFLLSEYEIKNPRITFYYHRRCWFSVSCFCFEAKDVNIMLVGKSKKCVGNEGDYLWNLHREVLTDNFRCENFKLLNNKDKFKWTCGKS